MESERENCWQQDSSDSSPRIIMDPYDAFESISTTSSLSDSTRSNSTITTDYEYNRDDFPRACEIEEFQSPSFEWPLSRIGSRQQTSGRLASIQYSNLPKKIAAKLQPKIDHLVILLCLSEVPNEALTIDDFAGSDVVQNAQQAIDKAVDLITTYGMRSNAFADLVEMVSELETAIADMCNLLGVNAVLVKSIQLAEHVAKMAGEVHLQQGSYTACQELKTKADRLAGMLWEAGCMELYERPTRRLVALVEDALCKAASLVAKCHAQANIALRVFTINIPPDAFKKVLQEVEYAIGSISWLLRVSRSSSSTTEHDQKHQHVNLMRLCYVIMHKSQSPAVGSPLPVQGELVTVILPVLYPIWEQIAKLLRGSPEEKADAAVSLLSIAQGNDYNGQLIIKEGGVGPLLQVVKEGKIDGQKSAVQTLGLLGRDPESVKVMVQAGACSVFSKVLKEGPIEVQVMVAWAVSKLAAHYPPCQDSFAQQNAVEILVERLVSDNETAGVNTICCTSPNHAQTNKSLDQPLLDPATLKMLNDIDNCAMATRVLGALAKGNARICRSIVESKLMSLFPLLLEKSPDEVQQNSTGLLLEMARMAELGDAGIRWYFFNPHSHDVTAIVNQLLRVVRKVATTNRSCSASQYWAASRGYS